MSKIVWFFFFFCACTSSFGQTIFSLETTQKLPFSKDTLTFEKTSINPTFFKIFDKNKQPIDSSNYKIDFKTSKLIFDSKFQSTDSVYISYLKYPDFLTKTYSIYSQDKVVPNQTRNLYSIQGEKINTFKPFDGLNTSGSITRGITIGNNQNAVVNSNLDLQITGKLSDKVSIRASIQDSNIPLQNNGYSQRLDEFDQIFIELFSDKWNIRAGDLFLENRKSSFLNFNKKVQGLHANFNFGNDENKTNVFASGALVRGQYAKSTFVGQEGNQGPYKLRGTNNELYILVISGSERVFVNGILLKRGENNDYIIDYNAGEIRFTTLFPITSEMRINVEYQYSDRNYTRFVSYFGGSHETNSWTFGANAYTESDIKNQSLQQNLSPEQVQILVAAGDNQALMNANSAYVDSYSENKILYKKIQISGIDVFEYSNISTDVLYNVKFSLVGNNLGDYILKSSNAIGKIYEYIAPISGIQQGNYDPVVKLIPPTKLQIANFYGKYNPSEKTNLDFEFGVSNNDVNLFSNLNDTDNKGIASKINIKQRLFTGKWNVDGFSNFQLIQENFKTIERFYTIEFNRDWNINTISGNQRYLSSGLNFELPQKGKISYQFENLNFSDNFSGNRNNLSANFNLNQVKISSQNSILSNKGNLFNSTFARSQSQAKYHLKQNWIGSSVRLENNQEKENATQLFTIKSQKFFEYGAFIGRGDSTKVFTEIGYLNRVNDSLQNNVIQRVNQSHSYYLKSNLFKTETRNLSIFSNYRILDYENKLIPKEASINTRILYSDQFFKQFVQLNSSYETNSGSIAQQEFTYLEVPPGQGVYTWNDYNQNGIQELQEFEVAPFQDLAKYVRIFLPNQVYLKTNQNKFSQAITLNPAKWFGEKGFKKLLSFFYNQTSFSIDRKILRDGNKFDINPFDNSITNLVGLNTSFRNSLYYNRGKQNFSTTYTYQESAAQNYLITGSQKSYAKSHQVQFIHLFNTNWLFDGLVSLNNSRVITENFAARNFEIIGYKLLPKISYLFSKNASWDLFLQYQNKENTIGAQENLKQTQIGTSFTVATEKKLTMNGEFSFYKNNFSGVENTPASFQILEGLQPGNNILWRLLLQKNLTQYLDININYQGRKSETSKTIHTGNIQLRAFF